MYYIVFLKGVDESIYGEVFKKLITGAKLSRGLSSIGVCPVFSNITNVLFGNSY